MHHFAYQEGLLHAEEVSLTDIAAEVGTPFYCYSSATLLRHFRPFDEALDGLPHLVCFAMKSNSNQATLKLLSDAGAVMDGDSAGEDARERAAGVPGGGGGVSGLAGLEDALTEPIAAAAGARAARTCSRRPR